MAKFINPFTDVGFKRIFGQEVNKEILISFLNALLEGERYITDLEFIDKEKLPPFREGRGLIYDIYCSTDTGEHIIVEMQNRYQTNFNDRAVYYASTDIAWQGERGEDWHYLLTPVYGVYFMNFTWNGEARLRTDVALADLETGKQFSDRLRLIFLQLPLIELEEKDCDTDFKKWLYVLKNMQTFDRMPFAAQKAVFEKLGSIAEIATMPKHQRMAYEESLRIYRDNISIMETERKQGREEKMLEIIHNMRASGLDDASISKYTGISLEELSKIV